MQSAHWSSRWLAPVGLGLVVWGIALSAAAQQPGPQASAPPDAVVPLQTTSTPSPTPPKAAVHKGLDGREQPFLYRTFTANTRPSEANRAVIAPPGVPPLNQALANRGIRAGRADVVPFGLKGEKVAIAFHSGEFIPPAGERLQAGLAQLAQTRAARAAAIGEGAGQPSVYGLILLSGRIDPELKNNLTGLGVELLSFYPYAAFQARIPVASLAAVAALPQVRWIGQPTAAQKLAPELRGLLAPKALQAGKKHELFLTFFGEDRDGQVRAELQAAGVELGFYEPKIAVQAITVDETLLPRLADMDAVLYIEPVRTGHVMNELGMSTINADWLWGSWDPAATPVKIGLLDTGCYAYHNDFSNLFSGMYGFSLISGENWYTDLNHHGTHVSGTILGEGNASYRYRGVAAGLTGHSDGENPDYLVAQILNRNGSGGSGSVLIQGMSLLDNGSGHAGYKRQVWNASIGGYGSSGTDPESREVDTVYGDNVLPVIAAGNSGPGASTVSTPGDAKGALTVGSIYNNTEGSSVTDTITGYSSRGPTTNGLFKPDIVSPGSFVDSVQSGTSGSYLYDWEGTSMATPHVTGLAAGLIGNYPGMPAWAVKATLLATAIDLGYSRNTQGLGKVDGLLSHYTLDGGWSSRWSGNGGTGDLQYFDIVLDQPVAELRVVMTYPDPPGAAGASVALVNDLDLYVQYSANGSTLTTDRAATYSDVGVDPVSVVKVANAPAGYYRIKIYSYSVPTGSQAWAATVKTVNTTLHPNLGLSLDLPYAVQPGSSFYAKAYATSSAYVASGVVGKISLLTGGTVLDGLWYNRRSKPSSSEEWIYFPSSWTSTPPGYYEVPQMNMGNIGAGYTRQMWWTLHGTSEGVKTVSYRATSVNGGTGTVSGSVIVDGTAPTMGPIESIHWSATLRPDVTCRAQDTLSGLNVGSALYRYSVNGGTTWSAWTAASCTGANRTTSTQTITASSVPFGQNSAANNRIQFYITDMAGNGAYSAITAISTPTPTMLTLNPISVAAGDSSSGMVTLSGAAPTGGAIVTLLSSNPAIASVPASVTVSAGATTAPFTVTTSAVAADTDVNISGTYGGATASATLTIKAPVSVSGTITLQGCVNSVQPITFVFRPTGGSSFARIVTLAADGSFTLTNIPAKSYNVWIKGAKWLAKVVPVDASMGDVSDVTATLLAGDVNNDNVISTSDYLQLKAAFGSHPGDPTWNEGADVNCDGVVSTADYLLVKANFGQTGDL